MGRAVASGAVVYVEVFWYARFAMCARFGRVVGHYLELLDGMKGHDAARWNVHLGAGFLVATWARNFVP